MQSVLNALGVTLGQSVSVRQQPVHYGNSVHIKTLKMLERIAQRQRLYMKPKPYNYEQAEKLGNYVRHRYKNQLSNGALQLYFFLPFLEASGLGLGKPITADYKKLATAAFCSKNSIEKRLRELHRVLCEVSFGKPIKGGKEATRVRRFTLSELMNNEPKLQLVDTTPEAAQTLAEILRQRSFAYGGEEIKPCWNILRTGRLQSARPNIQGDSKDDRAAKLCEGLKEGEVLIHVDFNSAEPTTLQAAIGWKGFKKSPYDLLSWLENVSREEAKKRVNMLAYCNNAEKVVSYWGDEARRKFMPYARALDAYKDKLFEIGKPRNGQRRFVQTLGGSKIIADRGDAPNRGRVLNWHIQGTIADILNASCLRLIDMEEVEGWRFCFLIHDAAYVIGTVEQAGLIQSVFEEEAARVLVPLTSSVDIYNHEGLPTTGISIPKLVQQAS